ncbi:VCBS repeat-containing protein [Myxococcaceae bacterium GXIMD 01537]
MRQAGWKWLLAVLALVSVSGCHCGDTPVESSLTVDFERPADGARLDDADGLDFDVAVVARDTAGSEVKLASAKLETRPPNSETWTPGPDAVLEGSRASFPRTRLLPRTNILRVSVVQEGSGRTAAKTITVGVGSDVTPSLEVTAPVEGVKLLAAGDADPATPGYQVAFTVAATGLAGRAGTLYCEGALAGVPPTAFTLDASGKAAARVTLAEPACDARPASCFAVVRKDGKDVASGRRNFALDTVAPRLVVAAPLAPVSSTTFALNATASCVEEGAQVVLSRPGAPQVQGVVFGGAIRFPAVTVPQDGEYRYTLRVSDASTNETSVEVPVTVASTVPELQFLIAKTLTADTVDGDLSNGLQAPATVRVDGLPVGTEVELSLLTPGPSAQPRRAVTAQVGAHRDAAFSVDLAEGTSSLQACVRNVAGLPKCVTETVSVSTGRPVCRILSPVDGAMHASTSTPVRVRVESGASTVIIGVWDAKGESVAEASGNASAGTANVDLVLPADGEYRLLATCGAGTSQRVVLGVDTTAPALAVNVQGLPDGTTVLGPDVPDTSLEPGMQINLEAATEARATVQATACGQTVPVSAQADASGAVTLHGVTVPLRGTCDVRVVSRDLAGNTSEKVLALTLAFTPGTLRFVDPPSDRYLGAADGTVRQGGGLTVSVRLDLEPTADGTLRLLRGTEVLSSVPVVAADRSKTFTGVGLDEGLNALRAELTGPGGTVASASVLLLVDTTPAAIRLVTPAPPPAAAPVYGISADTNADAPGIQRLLSYVAEGSSANATVDICTDVALTPTAAPCQDGSGWFTLARNLPPTNSLFTYPDGRYALKAVLRDGTLSASEPVSLTVDSAEPLVRGLTLEGDTNGDLRLNAAELPSGAPQLSVVVEGLEDGSPVVVRNASSPATVYGQGTVTGGRATVALNAIPTNIEGTYNVVVTVTDAAGNPNRVSNPTPLYPLNTAAFLSFRVDRVAPSLVVSAPTRATLGPADDASSAAGFQLRVTVNTDRDVGANGVHMELSAPQVVADVSPVDLVATHDFTLPATGTVDYILTLSAVDESGNRSAQTVRGVRVDLEAPTLSVVSPTANTVYDTTDLAVRVDVGNGEGLPVRIVSQVGNFAAQLVGELTVVSGVAQGTIHFPRGVQTVIADIRDGAGNTARVEVPGVNVDVIGCTISLTDPAGTPVTLLARDDRNPGAAGLQYRFKGVTPDCPGETVSLYRGGASSAEQTVLADASTGEFAFDVTLADGEQTRLTVEVLDEQARRAIDYVDVSADASPPAFSSVAPAGAKLYFVADSNAFLFPVPAADRVVDKVADGDANADFTVTVSGATGGSVRAFYAGSPVSSEFPVSASPATLTVPVTLPQGTVGTLELRVRDASGNEVVHAVDATVDVVPPAAPTVTRELVAGEERKARVKVSWTASGDDGVSGMPTGYDLRWSTNAVLKDGIPDEKTFFDTTKVKQATGAVLAAGTTTHTLTLPPLARYSIQLRPVDEVGNYARFTAEPVAQQLSNFWRQAVLNNPGVAGNGFALYSTGRGDLNADGRDDLVVSASSSAPGTAHVYYGSADPAAQAPVRQDLTLPETGSQFFGADFDIGDLGNDVDVVGDLAVGVRAWAGAAGNAANTGRVFLYFGRKGTTLDPTPIEIRGTVAAATVGGTVKIVDDITGDGLRDLLISAHGENKVYFFRGRSVAEWRELGGTGPGQPCGGSTPCHVPVTQADKVFTGDAGAYFFGRSRGYARVGDIDGDTIPELTLPVSSERHNLLYVYSGATVRSLASLTSANALQSLTQGPYNATSNSLSGFGVEALGGLNLAGGAGLDLAVSYASQSKVYVYRDGGAAGFTSAPFVIQGSGVFGNALAGADFNEDGRIDLAIGQNRNPGGSAFVFYNSGTSGAEFDATLGGGFLQSRLESDTSLGISLSVLDFNGDGKPDLAAGDSQSNPGRVVVYY